MIDKENKEMLLFSHFLNQEELDKVTYFSYYPVLIERSERQPIARILPSDDCIAYVTEFEIETKKILKGEKNWFNEALIEKIDTKRLLPDEKIKSINFFHKKHDKCIFFNLLDYCYGHSLVKLLNVQKFYEAYHYTHDIFIVSFPDIHDYFPKKDFSSCLLALSFSEIKTIHNLENLINKVKANYKTVDFPVMDAYLKIENKPSTIQFFNFYGEGPNSYKDKKIVSVCYRKELGRKLWGNSQAEQMTQFLIVLKAYFDKDVLYCILGDKDEKQFPSWILDKRVSNYPNPCVYEYSQIASSSILTIGVIGSNLMIPSLLSPGMVVHIVKEDFTNLTATDSINYNEYSTKTAFDHIYLYEDLNKRDFSPRDLAYKILRLFAGKLFINYRDVCIGLLRDTKKVATQAEFILAEHSYFKYSKVKQLIFEFNTRVYQKNKRQMIISLLTGNPLYLLNKVVKKVRQKLK